MQIRRHTLLILVLTVTALLTAAAVFSHPAVLYIGFSVTVLIIILLVILIYHDLRLLNYLTLCLKKHNTTHVIGIDHIPSRFKPLIRELNELLSTLQHTVEAHKRFSSDAAHELRTPLAAIKTQAQVALHAKNNSEQQTALHNVMRGVDRSAHLIDQLLILGRLEPQATLDDHETAAVDLNKLTIDTVALLVPFALEKNIDISLNNDQGTVVIRGNEISLGILIRNLVDNAIRYTPNGGQVLVSIVKQSDHVLLRVIDNGPGIPPELHQRVFERFFRVLGTKTNGSGLGLAIAKQITQLHRGQIIIKHNHNSGLCVEVFFPVYRSNAAD